MAAAGAAAGAALWLRRRARFSDHPFLQGKLPLVMAHQGGAGLWPSNTLVAFEHAASQGVDVLELDIQATADGVLVVRHDDTVDSTTQGQGPISRYTLAELKGLDAGYRWTGDGGATYPYRGQGLTIPTLEEVFAAFPGLRINIDIKPADPGVIEPFCRLLQAYNRTNNVMVGSFHDAQLRRFRRACPQAATSAGPSETRLFWTLSRAGLAAVYRPAAYAFQPPEWHGSTHVVTPQFIRAAHRHGMHVHVWTVNDPADMRRLLEWGVDGLITDYPDRLLSLIDTL